MVVGKDSLSTRLGGNSWFIRVRQRDRALRVRELARGAEGVVTLFTDNCSLLYRFPERNDNNMLVQQLRRG